MNRMIAPIRIISFIVLISSIYTHGKATRETIPTLKYIRIGSSEDLVPAMVEPKRFGGEWLVVMQRYDGTVKFNRTWAEYRDGFGMIGHEFWFGLEKMHQLTKERNHELIVELEDFNGTSKYGRYDNFVVGPGEKRYPLEELGAFNGTMGDSLSAQKKSGFSTFDNDAFGCSNKYANGGWWYYQGRCYQS